MINLKKKEEIEKMILGGKILIKVLKRLILEVRPGITTLELDKSASKMIADFGAKPSFKGHSGYPFTICASVNNEVVHSFPRSRILKEGDILSLDLGVFYKGFHTDAAVTLPVGSVPDKALKLIKVTFEALKNSLKFCKINKSLSDISGTVQKTIEKEGFSVVRDCTGHGIGKNLHEEPNIPNFVSYKDKKLIKGPELKEGMALCIEPIANMGSPKVEVLDDNWTIVTIDDNLSAHFEETIIIGKKGPIRVTSLDSVLDF